VRTVRRRRKEKTKGNVQEIEEDIIKPEYTFEYERGMGGMDMHEQIHTCFHAHNLL
jgi:hypothetical protein